jgi:hypothetical protein
MLSEVFDSLADVVDEMVNALAEEPGRECSNDVISPISGISSSHVFMQAELRYGDEEGVPSRWITIGVPHSGSIIRDTQMLRSLGYGLETAALRWLAARSRKYYYQTDHWRRLRRLAISRWQGRCALCNSSSGEMNVHHRHYQSLGAEVESDLILLCRMCHARHHGQLV